MLNLPLDIFYVEHADVDRDVKLIRDIIIHSRPSYIGAMILQRAVEHLLIAGARDPMEYGLVAEDIDNRLPGWSTRLWDTEAVVWNRT